MKNRKREICTSGSARDEAGQPPHLLGPEKISVSGSRCCRTSRDSELDGAMCWGFPPFVPWMLGTGMDARKLGTICALLAATPNLIGCESSRDSPDRQFQKQVKRAQECRQLQDKLVGDQPITPERAEEIAKTMDRAGCTTRLPAH